MKKIAVIFFLGVLFCLNSFSDEKAEKKILYNLLKRKVSKNGYKRILATKSSYVDKTKILKKFPNLTEREYVQLFTKMSNHSNWVDSFVSYKNSFELEFNQIIKVINFLDYDKSISAFEKKLKNLWPQEEYVVYRVIKLIKGNYDPSKFELIVDLYGKMSLDQTTVLMNQYSEKHINSEIEKKYCSEFDNSINYLKVRKQRGLGLCWANVGADLLSEIACQNNHYYCQYELSYIDFSRSFWKFGGDKYGLNLENFKTSLNVSIEEGICLEKDTYKLGRNGVDNIIEIYEKYLSSYEEKGFYRSLMNHRKTWEISRHLRHYNRGKKRIGHWDLKNKIENKHEDISDFFENVLITQKCKDRRENIITDIPFHDYYITNENIYYESFLTKIKVFDLYFKANQSIAISVNTNDLLRGEDLYSMPKRHALTIIGAHFNNRTNKCEVSLRNSWGNVEDLNGEHNLTDIINDINWILQLRRNTSLIEI